MTPPEGVGAGELSHNAKDQALSRPPPEGTLPRRAPTGQPWPTVQPMDIPSLFSRSIKTLRDALPTMAALLLIAVSACLACADAYLHSFAAPHAGDLWALTGISAWIGIVLTPLAPRLGGRLRVHGSFEAGPAAEHFPGPYQGPLRARARTAARWIGVITPAGGQSWILACHRQTI